MIAVIDMEKQTPPIVFDYLKLELNPPEYLKNEPGKYGSKLLDKQIDIMKVMQPKTLLLLDELIDIKTGIDKHKESHRFWKNWQNKTVSMTARQFLERVPANISVQKLRHLVINHYDALCLISGAKKIEWRNSERITNNKVQPSEIVFVFSDRT